MACLLPTSSGGTNGPRMRTHLTDTPVGAGHFVIRAIHERGVGMDVAVSYRSPRDSSASTASSCSSLKMPRR
jgi:hypothetical protein